MPTSQSLWARMIASLRPEVDHAPLVESARGLTLRQVITRFWPRLQPLRWWLVLGLVVLLVAPMIEVAEIMLYERVVDDVLVPADIGPLLWLAVLYVLLNLGSAVVSGLDDYLSTWISQRFLLDLRRDSFAHMLRLPGFVHDRRRLGDTLARLTGDVSAVESFMVSQLTEGLGAVLRLAFYLAALFYLQWELALASLIVIPATWWVATRFAEFTRDVSRERRRRGGSLQSITEESLSNAALVQVYGREAEAVESYHRQSRAIAQAELAGSRVRAVFLPMVDLVELVAILVVMAMGVWALSTDRLALGGLLAFLTLLAQCYRPVRDLSDLLPGLYSATAGIERLVELLDEEPLEDAPDATPLKRGSGEIRFDDVTVTYPGGNAPVLTKFGLSIPGGSRVALVGASGSGKSTVARLISRTLAPDSGTVSIDGQDLAGVTGVSVQSAVTQLPQENMLVDDTVRANLVFARPDATDAEVEAAASAADAVEFIERLPEGYETRIGQRGRTLSGGQRQRLALARALLHGGHVLVLDEPTTGLDEPAARRLMSALVSGAGDRTLIILTHDPVVLQYVDDVITLDAAESDEMVELT